MIRCIAETMITPLGACTEDNLTAVLAGRSALRLHTDTFPKTEPFFASLFPKRIPFTLLCIRCVEQLQKTKWRTPHGEKHDFSSPETVFVLSTTKGDDLQLWQPAAEVTRHFGNPNRPVVVSNACISGVCAQITAQRLLESGRYKTAVVVGCDVQTPFIVSGFQSFKALSSEACRPFDKDRCGLNLGEGVAAMVLTREPADEELGQREWVLLAGSCHNDANHISGPSRTGEGSYRCLQDVLKCTEGVGEVAFVNVHGTATLYNDEMESIALSRAGLSGTPINALKGYFGHTMGAAGVLETILSMRMLERGELAGTRGFAEQGTTESVNVSAHARPVQGNNFIKLLSGFGGCNAAIRWALL